MKDLQTFTATEMREDAPKVYREAVRRPVLIEHKAHGEMVLMSSDKYLELIGGDQCQKK